APARLDVRYAAVRVPGGRPPIGHAKRIGLVRVSKPEQIVITVEQASRLLRNHAQARRLCYDASKDRGQTRGMEALAAYRPCFPPHGSFKSAACRRSSRFKEAAKSDASKA